MRRKNKDPDLSPRGANQKVSVGVGREAYGITMDRNAKSAHSKGLVQEVGAINENKNQSCIKLSAKVLK